MVSNIAGTVASAEAVLTVTQPPPPQIDLIRVLPSGQIQLQVSGAPGHYAVEATTNLLDWAELTNFTTAEHDFRIPRFGDQPRPALLPGAADALTSAARPAPATPGR